MNSKKHTLRHTVIKLSNTKGKEILESSKREATYHIKGILSQITSRFLIKNFGARRQWANIFNVIKEKTKSTKNPVSGKTVLQK